MVVTWNVEYAAGAERNARRAQLIRDANADIVVLTENVFEISGGAPPTAVTAG